MKARKKPVIKTDYTEDIKRHDELMKNPQYVAELEAEAKELDRQDAERAAKLKEILKDPFYDEDDDEIEDEKKP